MDMSHECTVADPEHYHLEFENEYVRVIRCRIPGRDKVKMHNHPFGSVIIFMTDQNLHQTLENGTTEEAHNKAGHVLWGNGSQANTWARTSRISCMNTFEWTSRRPCPSARSAANHFYTDPSLSTESDFWQHSSL